VDDPRRLRRVLGIRVVAERVEERGEDNVDQLLVIRPEQAGVM